jgi:hypothetical protein
MEAARKRRELYQKWFNKWSTLPTKKRHEWWHKLVRSSATTCTNRKQVCHIRRVTLREFRKERSELRFQQMQLSFAIKSKNAIREAEFKKVVMRLSEEVKAVGTKRELYVKKCRTARVECRVVVHRYHVILRARVNWMYQRLAVWEERARVAHYRMEKGVSENDITHFKMIRENAVKVVRQIRGHLERIEQRRMKWLVSRRAARMAAWKRRIAAWRNALQCERRTRKKVATYINFYNRAIRVGRAAMRHRNHELGLAARAEDKESKEYHLAQAAKLLARFRRAQKAIDKLLEERQKYQATNRHCERRAVYLLNRARYSALRRAKILAARRTHVLRRAKDALHTNKKLGKNTPEEVARYKKALQYAHLLAVRAQDALQRARKLVQSARIEAAKSHQSWMEKEKEQRLDAARRLRQAARHNVIASRQRAARLTAERKEARERRAALLRARQERLAKLRASEWRTRRNLFRKKHTTMKYARASASGDPHIHTFTGKNVMLQTDGDYVLFKGVSFECQARAQFVNVKAKATALKAISCKLPGNDGDVVEISSTGVAVNRVLRKLTKGMTQLTGGMVFRAKDSHGIDYFRLSMLNGIFVTINVNSNGALNIVAAVPTTVVGDVAGLMTTVRSTEEIADLEDSFRPQASLFVEPAQRAKGVSPTGTGRVVNIDALEGAEELCRRAFASVSEAWGKCSKQCKKVNGGQCLIDATQLSGLSELEQRACECLFDVAAAGSSYAKVDARAARLVDDVKKSSPSAEY